MFACTSDLLQEEQGRQTISPKKKMIATLDDAAALSGVGERETRWPDF